MMVATPMHVTHAFVLLPPKKDHPQTKERGEKATVATAHIAHTQGKEREKGGGVEWCSASNKNERGA
jgi:hypothetical protein